MSVLLIVQQKCTLAA